MTLPVDSGMQMYDWILHCSSLTKSWLGVAHERFMRQVEGVGGTI